MRRIFFRSLDDVIVSIVIRNLTKNWPRNSEKNQANDTFNGMVHFSFFIYLNWCQSKWEKRFELERGCGSFCFLCVLDPVRGACLQLFIIKSHYIIPSHHHDYQHHVFSDRGQWSVADTDQGNLSPLFFYKIWSCPCLSILEKNFN